MSEKDHGEFAPKYGSWEDFSRRLPLQQAIHSESGGKVTVDDDEMLIATLDIGLKAEDKVRQMIHRHFPRSSTVLDDDIAGWGNELLELCLRKRREREVELRRERAENAAIWERHYGKQEDKP